jgi:hypothetical protein
VGSAPQKHFHGTGQQGNIILETCKKSFVQCFETLLGGFRQKLGVESGKRQTKVLTKFVQRELALSVFAENAVGCGPHRAQVICQRAGPIKDKIADHGNLEKAAGY